MTSAEAEIGRTLRWIVGFLRDLDVPHQAVGGLAARAYGATRPLVDLDFYVPASRLDEIVRATPDAVVRPPSAHLDESWDLTFLQLQREGVKIELAGAEDARYRLRATGEWVRAGIDFAASVEREVFDIRVPVMPLDQLIAYKRALDRDVDRQDLAELARGWMNDGTR